MYLDNKYTRTYYSLISKAVSRNFKTRKAAVAALGYVERHHIIPKSLGGTDAFTNLVFLTGREHFVCHWLLVKMTVGLDHERMIFALNGMRRKTNHQSRYDTKITSRVYNKYKLLASEIKRKRQIGGTQTEESNRKRRNTQTGVLKGAMNKNKYTFYHYDGRVVTCTCYELRNQYGVSQGNLSKMISKNSNVKCVNGWSLTKSLSGKRGHNQSGLNNPASDKKMYIFYNGDLEIVEHMTQYHFKTKYNLSKSGVSAICNKKQKSCKGWSVKDQEVETNQ